MTKRASTSDEARAYRQRGHDNALTFAKTLGIEKDYTNDLQAKKDVIDPSGDAHSVKSGEKKWQLFLYGRNRFLNDDGFLALNGVGQLLIHCIDSFPSTYEEYKKNPEDSKIRLQTPMRELKDRFQRKALLRAFLMKAIFNGGEVNYLSILSKKVFHVFLNTEVIQIMGDAFSVINSTAKKKGDYSDQKVLFCYKGFNVGELEMRNDSKKHYQQIRFNMNIKPAMELLMNKIKETESFFGANGMQVVVHGKASKRFARWRFENHQ